VTTTVQLRLPLPPPTRHYTPVPTCRECGCTDTNACVHPLLNAVCCWEEPDLCSACSEDSVPGWVHPVVRHRRRARA
jgi:hypothetical protein